MTTSEKVEVTIAALGIVTLFTAVIWWVFAGFEQAQQLALEEQREWEADVRESRNMLHVYALAIESGSEDVVVHDDYENEIKFHRELMHVG